MKYFTLILIFFIVGNVFSQDTLLYINEILTGNENINKDRFNEFDDWIEIYNPNGFPVDLGGMHISNNPEDLTGYTFPTNFIGRTTIQPKSYKLVWFDNSPSQGPLHTSLKLSSKGEEIILTGRDGKHIFDKVSFGKQKSDISYGRFPDGNSNFRYFDKPTPETTNNNAKSYSGISEYPEISKKGGFYAEPVKVKIEIPKGAKVLYTINGKKPDETNGIIYNSPISIDSSTVLRIKCFEEDKMPSMLYSNTFFIGEKFTFPVVSLTTNDADILKSTDPKLNIYKEIPLNIEYFDRSGESIFNTMAGFRLVGKAIRNYPQKSMSIRFRSSYGLPFINYKFFPLKKKTKYYSFLLRNSGNDCSETLFKDALMHRLVTGTTHIDCQGYQPVIVFINGKYWGIHNMREKINKFYIASNFPKVNYDNIDMIEWGSKPIQGDNKHFDHLINFIKSNDISLTQNYDSVLAMIDIENYTDYQIAEIFYANTDWPMANMKYWRPHTKDGKWRWIMFDTDLAFNKNKTYCKGHHNTLDYALGINNCHLPHLTKSLAESTIILQKLILNDEFKIQFINRFADLMNTIFAPQHILSTIDELKNDLEPEIDRHIQRWGKQKGIANRSSWETHISNLRTFATERADTMRMFIDGKFLLGGTGKINLSIDNNEGGTIKINTIIPDKFPFEGIYFNKLPVTLQAIPDDGYKFVKWSDGKKSITREISIAETNTLSAIFEKTGK